MTSHQFPETPVRASVSRAAGELDRVRIDDGAVRSVADEWADEAFETPGWRAPVFPDESDPGTSVADVIDFLFLGNAVNFAFRDFETGADFRAEYDGHEYRGAFGMWACLKRALDAGEPVLAGAHLARLDRAGIEELFAPAGGPEMPMLDERLRILRSVGERLVANYGGRFHELVRAASPRLFDDGDGIVDLLVAEFPSFADTHALATDDGTLTVHLHKRAQLAAAMAYGRFRGTPHFPLEAPGEFTVFADYNLPNVLRGLGILSYDDRLAARIDAGTPLERGSREEVELRVGTVAAADRLMAALADRREDPVYGPAMDYRLFAARDAVDTPVHRTRTTDY